MTLVRAPAIQEITSQAGVVIAMTVTALLSVAPAGEDSMAEHVATAVDALDDHDVRYETNPMGTVIEAADVGAVFAAARDAHDAVDADRVETLLKIDDDATTDASGDAKVRRVEEVLGRTAASDDRR